MINLISSSTGEGLCLRFVLRDFSTRSSIDDKDCFTSTSLGPVQMTAWEKGWAKLHSTWRLILSVSHIIEFCGLLRQRLYVLASSFRGYNLVLFRIRCFQLMVLVFSWSFYPFDSFSVDLSIGLSWLEPFLPQSLSPLSLSFLQMTAALTL